MTPSRLAAYGLALLTVSASAFAPEVLWQGALVAGSHSGLADAATALFVAVLLACFLEPMAERLKPGHRHHRHAGRDGRQIVAAGIASLLVALAMVCAHDAITAYFGGHGVDGERWARLRHAMAQALEWSSVPAAVTAAWFVGCARPRRARLAAGLAALWAPATGIACGWTATETLATTAACGTITALAAIVAEAGWQPRTTATLAKIVGGVAAIGIPSVLLVQAAACAATGADAGPYGWGEAFEDARFYGGWAAGLLFAEAPGWRPARRDAPRQAGRQAPRPPLGIVARPPSR